MATIEHVRLLLRRATGDEKHDASTLSTFGPLWVLYDRVLRVDPADPAWPDRDRFILSKGHGPASLYAVLAAKGFFPPSELDAFMRLDGRLGSHPDRTLVPGVEASTGSLGHGLAIGVGVALGLRAKGATGPHVYVLCGDAELNEGSNWEAILLAPHLALANLTVLVIDNASSSIAMTPWEPRLRAFGWRCTVVDADDDDRLAAALTAREPAGPTAVVVDATGASG
jgi:transketolase